ncbi:MAG: hypothetical protein K2I80_02850, partial [Ruminococcus sp.]|nr:hypothetical protein [Ruminococcus sp.]
PRYSRLRWSAEYHVFKRQMKSGMMYSNACALDGIIERIEEELGEKCTVVATGGLAELVVPLCKRDIILDKSLLIKGLTIVHRKNKPRKSN